MAMNPSFIFLFLSTFLFATLVPDLGMVGVEAAPASASAVALRRRRGTGCGPQQCYYASLTSNYGGCFHETSRECTSLLNEAGKRPSSASTPTSTETATSTSTVTSPPTPSPSPKSVTVTVTQSTQITESPILFRLINVAEDYILSPSDRARYLSMIQEVLDQALDDSWEIISVDYLGEYLGERRLQSFLRLRGYRNRSRRQLNRTMYLPVLVTLRGDKDLSGLARTFILQALGDKSNFLLTNLKSLNPNAFRNVQLSIDELSLTDVAIQSSTTNANAENNSSGTSTNTNIESKSSSTSSDVSASQIVVPFWVWIIAAAVCIPLGFFLLMCICMEGCRCCTFKSKGRLNTDDIAIPMAILHGYGNSYGVRYAKRKRDVRKTRVREQHDTIQSHSEGARRHRSSRGRGDERRRYRLKRRDHGDSAQRDRYAPNRNSNMVSQIDRSPSRLVPVQRKSPGMMGKELESEKINVQDERALVILPAQQASLTANNQSQDPPIEYQNALVVYDDEKIRFTLEPEGPKIEDVQPETAVVLYVPPKEPEGTTASAAVPFNLPNENEEAPRKKSKKTTFYDEGDMKVYPPYTELHRNVTETTYVNRSEEAQYQDIAIRKSFASITTQN